MTSAPPPATPPPSLDPPAWEPPPPPPGPPAHPQLRRSRTDKMIGGVAGGLAEYSGVDPLLWRVGFVALTFAGGSGVLVYLLLWLLMPAGPPGDPASSGSHWSAGRSQRPPAGPRSPIPRVTIAGLFIVVGLLVLTTRFGGWDIGPRGFLGAALLVVGIGLVIAAFAGGHTARGRLIALGVVLSLALVAASSMPWRNGAETGAGDSSYRPTSAQDVRSVYRGGFGDLRLDLTDVRLSGLDQPIRTRIQHGVGDIRVLVPRSADFQLRVDQGVGDVTVFGAPGATDGLFPGTGSASWTGDGRPEIVLSINSGLGDVEVSRG
jgi:phage shock protein PspC (stress-responsive transcriptional regulator)